VLNLDRLASLVAVRDHGSIRAAAQVLHLTPSALSQQLARLQQEIGSAVTAPHGRGIRLTPMGLLLAERATAILDLAARAESELASFDTAVAGIVRVGSFTSASRVIVPRAVRELKKAHPELEIRFHANDSEVLLDAVHQGILDLALVDSWDGSPLPVPAGVSAEVLYRDVADIALPNDHPLARRRKVSLEQLGDVAWVAWRPGETFTDWLIQTLRRRGIEPNIQYDVPEFATQLEFVAAGLGAAIVPRLASVWVSPAVSLVEVEPALGREILAVLRRDGDRPAVRAVVSALRDSFAAESERSAKVFTPST
jgi:DNA-binding transcriptional LysR family regulator